MKIDLHNHTKYSDGVDTPLELFNSAKKNHVDVFALTGLIQVNNMFFINTHPFIFLIY